MLRNMEWAASKIKFLVLCQDSLRFSSAMNPGVLKDRAEVARLRFVKASCSPCLTAFAGDSTGFNSCCLGFFALGFGLALAAFSGRLLPYSFYVHMYYSACPKDVHNASILQLSTQILYSHLLVFFALQLFIGATRLMNDVDVEYGRVCHGI